jgi:hypothetical protein
MQPRIESITFNCSCRDCGESSSVTVAYDEPCDEFDIEVEAHEAFEDAGWVDGRCPPCFLKAAD